MEIAKQVYTQNWSAYNEAQTQEKVMFMDLLFKLVQHIPQLPGNARGRPKLSSREMVFCCCLKAYNGFSSRRSNSELELAKKAGYITRTPHFNTVLNSLRDPKLTLVLRSLVHFSSIPLAGAESSFAVDSTGFSTNQHRSWMEARNGAPKGRKRFVKAHAICGTKTNVITAIEVTPSSRGDAPLLPGLVAETTKAFNVREVSADKAYSSQLNYEAIDHLGAAAYVPFRSGTGRRRAPAWDRAYDYYTEQQEDFLKHYHKRSNIESTFSMIKRKFTHYVRSKTTPGQINEVLCLAVCHNVVVLIHELLEGTLDLHNNASV
jgi:transposase